MGHYVSCGFWNSRRKCGYRNSGVDGPGGCVNCGFWSSGQNCGYWNNGLMGGYANCGF